MLRSGLFRSAPASFAARSKRTFDASVSRNAVRDSVLSEHRHIDTAPATQGPGSGGALRAPCSIGLGLAQTAQSTVDDDTAAGGSVIPRHVIYTLKHLERR